MGWPVGIYFASEGHTVTLVDNLMRRQLCRDLNCSPLFDLPNSDERTERWSATSGQSIEFILGDVTDYDFLCSVIHRSEPEVIIHFAEQPSAPYSMRGFKEAHLTVSNNVLGTLALAHAVKELNREIHIVKLGTMGEYGTPNIDIEEGYITISHKGRKDKFLYPRQAGSLYHTSKIQDTDLLYFFVRTYGLRVTDLMQGPVYGFETPQMFGKDQFKTCLNYDGVFGTVFNRFLLQAVTGYPLTIYGGGGQVRGYINLLDTIQCINLAVSNPADSSEMKILNQFTETFSVKQLAEKVCEAGKKIGLSVEWQLIENPRIEEESHYYSPKNSSFLQLGLEPHLLTADRICAMLEGVLPYAEAVATEKFQPTVKWN